MAFLQCLWPWPDLVERNYAVAFGVVHRVGKNCGSTLQGRSSAQHPRQVLSVEDVVAQHQRTRPVANEVLADQESLRKAARSWLGSYS